MCKAFGLVGFTGTRQGMTVAQKRILSLLLQAAQGFLHGDCIGSDEEAHYIALSCGITPQILPANLRGYRAFCKGGVLLEEPQPPLDRNKRIVDLCSVLFACVDGPEKRRSGTWSTVRYARKQGNLGLIIMPDGKIQGL